MTLALKSRIQSLVIFSVVMAALVSSVAWPSPGTANVATLAMVALNAFYAVAVFSLGCTLAHCKHSDADKRSEAQEVIGNALKARDQRSAFGKAWSLFQCACMAVLSAYAGMLFAGLLYGFLSMIIRLQFASAPELVGKVNGSGLSSGTN